MPAARPLAVAEVPPLGAHEYVYVGVPPVGVTVAEPEALPKHNTSVLEAVAERAAAGWVMETVCI